MSLEIGEGSGYLEVAQLIREPGKVPVRTALFGSTRGCGGATRAWEGRGIPTVAALAR